VRWPGKTSGAIGFALNFLLLLFFVSKPVPICREQRKGRINQLLQVQVHFMFFLLLVQKKERKKSTPAMMYGHCRTP
jgi:hypothetical protein